MLIALPDTLTRDQARLARLRRDVELLASIDQRHVAAFHGLEEHEGRLFLAVEAVDDGETLRARLRRGALPLQRALDLARQLAEALEAVHGKGVVHGGLEPRNIILKGSKAKLLGCGLMNTAAGTAVDGFDVWLPALASGTPPIDRAGEPVYLSPEQARGQPADQRADIWAFGAIVYEMLSGKAPFARRPASGDEPPLLGAKEIDWSLLPGAAPAAVQRLLAHCLTWAPRERLQHIGDARIELRDASVRQTASRSEVWRRRLPWMLAGLFGVALTALGGRHVQNRPASPAAAVQSSLAAPKGAALDLAGRSPGPPVLSPDGRHVAFSARQAGGTTGLYVRRLEDQDAKLLSGAEGAAYPFWSPDGQWIGFFSETDAKLKKIEANGGTPVTLCDAADGRGASWSNGGVIVFAAGPETGLQRVSATGGVPAPVTQLDTARGDTSHRHPRFLPDGRRFLYVVVPRSLTEEDALRVGSLESSTDRQLLRSATQAEFAGGQLVYVRQGRRLIARPFDPERLAFAGPGQTLAHEVMRLDQGAYGVFSTAANGTAVYQAPGKTARMLSWFDRAGRRLKSAGPGGRYDSVSLSPDGTSAAVTIGDELWMYDTGSNALTRLTQDPAADAFPVWFPSGESLFFASNRSGRYDLFQRSRRDAGADELLFASQDDKLPTSVSPDGRWLVFNRSLAETRSDIWALPLSGKGAALPVVATTAEERSGQLSPDGRWIAYSSDDSGRLEIYVSPFPEAARRWQVSKSGGDNPRWRGDGKEIVFEANGFLKAAPVEAQAHGFQTGPEAALFDLGPTPVPGPRFALASDGSRFLVITEKDSGPLPPLTLLSEWTAKGPRREPRKRRDRPRSEPSARGGA